MPSGITSDIYEGKDVSLRDYLMRVGRQMGYAIAQRDDAFDAPIKPIKHKDTYYEDSVKESEAKIRELEALGDKEASICAQQDYDKALRLHEEAKAKKKALRERYLDMKRQVQDWSPHPLMASTKQQAIKFLDESIEFDINMDYRQPPQPTSGSVWKTEQLKRERRMLAHAQELAEEQAKRENEREAYIQAFLDSLPEE